MELDKKVFNEFVRVDAQIRAINLELALMQSQADALSREQAGIIAEQAALYAENGLDPKLHQVVTTDRTKIKETGEPIAKGRVIVTATGKDYIPPPVYTPEQTAAMAKATQDAIEKAKTERVQVTDNTRS